MANNIKGITIDIGGNVTKLTKALSDVNKDVRNTQDELKEVNKLLKLDPKNTEALAQKQKLLKNAIAETKEKLDVLKTAEAQVEEQFQKGEISEEQYRALKREIEATELSLKNLEDQAKESGITLEKVGSAFGKIGETSTDLGKKMLPVTTAVLGAGTAAGAMASSFEDAMAKVSTIADTTEVPLEELQAAILELSDETGIAATDIADNVYNAISAGQSTGDAVNFVSNATKLAKAGFTESSSALDILTTAMNAYGMEADEVTKVSDLLIQTQNLGKTTVGELSSSMGKVIPTAKANNVEIEQLCAGYAILTANGIATAESTTYMNSMLNELGKGGTKVDEVLREKTGKSFSELSAEGKSMGDVLRILKDYADETGVSFSDIWSSSEAGKAGLVLLGNGADDFNNKLAEMNNATGATDSAFDKLDTTSNQIKITINQLKNTAIDLGSVLIGSAQPIIEQVSGKVKSFTNWFKNLNNEQKQTILMVAAVVAAIGPALIMFGKVCTGISSIITIVSKVGPAIKAVKTAFTALGAVLAANPMILIVAAVIAVIAILVTLYNKCEWFRNGVNAIWDAVKTAFFAAWDAVVNFFTVTLPDAFNAVVDFVKSNWQGLLLFIVNPFAGAFKLLYDNCESFRNFIDNILLQIKQFFQNLWDGIVSVFSAVGQWFIDRFTEAYNGVTGVFAAIGTWFDARWQDIKNALAAVALWFLTTFTDAYTNITTVFAVIGTWFSQRWQDVKNALNAIPAWFQTQFQNAWSNIKNVFSGVGSFFAGIWNTIKSQFTNIGQKIGNSIGGAFKTAMNSALASVERAVNNAIGFINGAIDVINKLPGVSVSHVGNVSLPRLAKGGVLENGQAIVAEAGPELISMVNGKTIVTPLTGTARNTAMQAAGGNGGYNQTINIYSPKQPSPYEIARQTRNQTQMMVLALQRQRG